jgi:hypothetical protein
MALNIADLQSSAAQLNKVNGAAKTTGKVFTALQASSSVQSYTKSQNSTALNSIVANYQTVFDAITVAAAKGETSIVVTTTKFDYSYVAPLFRSYGYTVGDLAASDVNITDTTLKFDIEISWPDTAVTAITGITPGSFIAIQNSPYSVTFQVQGGQAPYTFELTGLPQGWTSTTLTKVTAVTITGTSTVLGGGSLVVKITDNLSQQFTATVNWTVTQPAQVRSDWSAISGLAQILNKPFIPTSAYLGTTLVQFSRATGALTLEGVSVTGNASTVTDGVVTSGSYANPAWITSLAGSKVTDAVLTTGSYTDPNWLQLTQSKVGLNNVTNESKATMFTSPTLTGTPLAPTALAGTNTQQIATTEFVKTAVDNLLNSAPAQLDTLNELSLALGNDQNFATTVTTSIGLKAPLASPTFTGTVTAPEVKATTAITSATESTVLVTKDYVDKKFFFSLAVGIY